MSGFTWSYSRWSCAKKCLAKYKFQFIDKIASDTVWSTRGSEVHAKAEAFVKGSISGMPKDLRPVSEEITQLRDLRRSMQADVEVENDFAITQDYKPCKWDDWNEVWCRSKLDVAVNADEHITVIDYKTGQIYPEHLEQGHTYGVCAASHFPNYKSMRVEMWYTDIGKFRAWNYTKKDIAYARQFFTNEIKKLARTKEFTPNPTDKNCYWCPYKASKGGPCEYG